MKQYRIILEMLVGYSQWKFLSVSFTKR